MRNATSNMGFVFSNTGKVQGLALGYDFCAEHEHGVSVLRQKFGIPYPTHAGWESHQSWYSKAKDIQPGLASRKITQLPSENNLVLIEFYAKHEMWNNYKKKFLEQYPECKKALNAKVKHALMYCDSYTINGFTNTQYIAFDETQSLYDAMQEFKVADYHYVLDKSKKAEQIVKLMKKQLIQNQELSDLSLTTYVSDYPDSRWQFNTQSFMSTSWCESGFAVLVKTDEYVGYLKQLFNALMQKDICFMGNVSGNSWTKVGGLVLGIYSELYADYNEAYVKTDQDKLAFTKAFVDLHLDDVRKDIDATWISPAGFDQGELIVWVNTNNRTGMPDGYYPASEIVKFAKSNKQYVPVKYERNKAEATV